MKGLYIIRDGGPKPCQSPVWFCTVMSRSMMVVCIKRKEQRHIICHSLIVYYMVICAILLFTVHAVQNKS